MRADIFAEAQRLRPERRPFALATVVAAHQPASGTPGARALILPDGTVQGWIGGHCAGPTVQRQGLEGLREGPARLGPPRPDIQVAGASGEGGGRMPLAC